MEYFDLDFLQEAVMFFMEAENKLYAEHLSGATVDLKVYLSGRKADLEKYMKLVKTIIDGSPEITTADYFYPVKEFVLPHYEETGELKVNISRLKEIVKGITEYRKKQREPDCSPGNLEYKISN